MSIIKQVYAKIIPLIKGNNRNFNTLIFLIIVNMLLAAIGFATRIKMANILGSLNYGILSYSIAISSYIETITRYGTDKTLIRDIVQQEHRMAEIVGITLLLKLILLFTCLIILSIYIKMYPNKGSDLVLWVIIGSSLISLEAKGVYDATNNIRRHSIYFAFYRIMFFVSIWSYILIFDSQLTVKYVGISMTATACIYLAIQYGWIFSQYLKKIRIKTLILGIWEWLARNFFLCFSALCGLGFTNFNQLILKNYCGSEELGVYSAAWQFFWVGNIFIEQISRIGQPIFARKLQMEDTTESGLFMFVVKYLAVMVMTVLPIAVPMIVFPEFIISNFFSHEYAQSITPLRFIGLYILMLSCGIVFSQYVIISNKDKLYMYSVLVTGLLSMLIAWLFIPKYQATGAAITLVVSHGSAIVLYGIITFYDILRKRHKFII
ncbi:MAG: oligosaccharide flippase family protein [Desulfamplus sp.]|nr:oligosaccharide flippase family protein [Desulfamplus sp.]